MNKIKIIFSQALMISTGILAAIGAQSLILHFTDGYDVIEWQWYIPLSIVLAGLLCALPTVFIFSMSAEWGNGKFVVGTIVHFIFVLGIVSVCGKLFGWYTSLSGYIPILIMYVVIYLLVWAATVWIGKNEEKKINEAIKDFRDEE